MIVTRRSIWRTMTSMCLSWIDTPLAPVHLLDLVDQVDLHLARAHHAQHLVRIGSALHETLKLCATSHTTSENLTGKRSLLRHRTSEETPPPTESSLQTSGPAMSR
ncbi:hypothetical protein AXA44_46055 [Rhodococcus sp. SC4]|nr:hypothetical protein AXA44_46055 [Rhodococcus sp. SC4]